jgi:hypothetical protein
MPLLGTPEHAVRASRSLAAARASLSWWNKTIISRSKYVRILCPFSAVLSSC